MIDRWLTSNSLTTSLYLQRVFAVITDGQLYGPQEQSEEDAHPSPPNVRRVI